MERHLSRTKTGGRRSVTRSEQQLVEPRQNVLAPDEPGVSLPLDREVDPLAASAHAASPS